MAKRKPKTFRFIPSTHWAGKSRKVGLTVSISRHETKRTARAFVACAYFALASGRDRKSDWKDAPKLRGACGFGKNPRTAVAGALRKAAASFTKRSGTFAGL